MRRVAAFLLLVLCPALALAQHRRAAAPAPIPPSVIAPLIAPGLADGAPAMSVAIGRGDSIVFAEGFGSGSATEVYQIGSVTKQFVAAAIMRLAERGALHLDDPLETFVPEMAGKGILIRHLLTHTSGLARDIPGLTSAYVPLARADVIKRIAAAKLDFKPGLRFQYSNAAYYLLAVVIEKASGRPYARYLDEELFAPLGLTSTSVCGTKSAPPDGYLVSLATHEVAPVRSADMSLLFGAGDICSTVTDLVRWNRGLAGGLAVSRASYAEMTTPRVDVGSGLSYGYGLLLGSDRGNAIVLHDGLVLGFNALLLYYPERDVTIAVTANAIRDDLVWEPAVTAGLNIGAAIVPAR